MPVHLRDASYPGARALGHGEGYQYPHAHPGGWVRQQYLPAELTGARYNRAIEYRLPTIITRVDDQGAFASQPIKVEPGRIEG